MIIVLMFVLEYNKNRNYDLEKVKVYESGD